MPSMPAGAPSPIEEEINGVDSVGVHESSSCVSVRCVWFSAPSAKWLA